MSAKVLFEYNLNECISSLDFSKSGDYVSAGLIDERVLVYKIEENNQFKETYKFEGNTLGVIDTKFNSIGNTLAVSSLDSNIRIYNIDEGQKISEIACNPLECWKLAFDPSDRNIITCGELGLIKFYDIETQENTKILKTSEIFATSIAYSKNDKFLAVGNNIGNVFIFDMQGEMKPNKIDAHGKIVRSLQFTTDSLKLITASDDQHINVIDLTKMVPILTLSGCKGNINCIDTHPLDIKKFISCSYDKSVKLWDLDQKCCVESIDYHQDNVWSAKFSSDGKIIGSAAENGMLVFHTF